MTARSRAWATVVLGLGFLGAWHAEARPRDESGRLRDLVGRMDQYFEQHEVDGVTIDSRYDINPSEAIRMSVVCQLLGYAELHGLQPEQRIRDDMTRDADYLISRLDEIRSHTPFDGMLGYSLLAAYDATREDRFLSNGALIVEELKGIPTGDCILNGGLMVAMATAKYWRLTGDVESRQKSSDIIAGLPSFQNADGSFPHWCAGSRDIHYTGWMAHELIHLERLTGDTLIPPILSRMNAFMEGRIGADGRSRYAEPCSAAASCSLYYYSRKTGCDYDYDTRGWTVEPGYQVLLFDRFDSPKTSLVLDFLLSLENGGTFSDLYAYWPPPEDPEYPWTIADTSVANMSIIFWSLATALSGSSPLCTGPGCDPQPSPAAKAISLEAPIPNPVRDRCRMRFVLPAPGNILLAIYDPSGRRVRVLAQGKLPAGGHIAPWDARDDAGYRVRSGVYFARLVAEGEIRSHRVLVLR